MTTLGCWACQGVGDESLGASRKGGPLWFRVSESQNEGRIQWGNATSQVIWSPSFSWDTGWYSFDWHLYSTSSWVFHASVFMVSFHFLFSWSVPLHTEFLSAFNAYILLKPHIHYVLLDIFHLKVSWTYSMSHWIRFLITPCFLSPTPERLSFPRKTT